ncbi:MAG TPA: T9SS type A sorting domain-containing protein [Chitinophagaceae bacterium]|nr:T9SS type A sorting domain-containing protein [Chitinophagaceae bacterium]
MKHFLIIIFLLSFGPANSQTPPWEWARTSIGNGVGNGWQESFSIASDHSGNVYLSGFFEDSILTIGSFTLTNYGTNNILLAKYDSTGTVFWAKSSYGAGDNECNDIAVDNSSNSYLTGKFGAPFVSFDTDTLFKPGAGTNPFLVKYDQSGNEIWAKGGEGAGTNIGTSVAVDTSGNIYIAGSYNAQNLIFDSDTVINTAAGFTDVFIVKYNSAGNVIWVKNIGGILAENCSAILTDNSGNLYITGIFSSPNLTLGAFTLTCTGGVDLYIAKLDPSGNVLWAKSAGGSGSEYGYNLTLDLTGNLYLTGMFSSPNLAFDNDTLFCTGNLDAFLVKYDSLGNIIWAKSSTGSENEIGYCILADPLGDVYLSGAFSDSLGLSFGGIVLPRPANSFDPMFILKLDSMGNAFWGSALASGGDDQNAIAFGTNGSLYTAGDFYNVNPFIIGCDTLVRTSSENVFVAKMGRNLCPEIESVQQIINGSNTVIFPNPFCEKINVNANDTYQSEIILYDILSRKLLQHTFTNSTTLNTEQLAKGIYIYEVRNKNGMIQNGKVVKE